MEQDEVYHRAMDAAGNKIKNGEGGVGNDGRPLANAARSQRHAIQTEQVYKLCPPSTTAQCFDGKWAFRDHFFCIENVFLGIYIVPDSVKRYMVFAPSSHFFPGFACVLLATNMAKRLKKFFRSALEFWITRVREGSVPSVEEAVGSRYNTKRGYFHNFSHF